MWRCDTLNNVSEWLDLSKLDGDPYNIVKYGYNDLSIRVPKLAYIAAPYSNVADKQALMRDIAKFSGLYMMKHPDWYAVTGLVHHYATLEVPELGTDYEFWQDWCTLFMSKCDKLIVLTVDGWERSAGVAAEVEFARANNIPIEYHRCV